MANDELKREIVQKAVDDFLGKHQVPARQLLAVVKQLHETMAQHKADIATHRAAADRHGAHMDAYDKHVAEHEAKIAPYLAQIEEFLKKDWTGAKGDPGKPGRNADTPSIAAIVAAVRPYLEPGAPGKPGEPGKAAEVDEQAIVSLLLDKILNERVLTLDHIAGAREYIKQGRKSFKKDGVSYDFAELMHGGGRTSSGSGLNYLAATGTVNNTNKVFTFPSAPVLVVVNGATYRNGFGATIVGLTATLDNAPGNGGDVYGLG